MIKNGVNPISSFRQEDLRIPYVVLNQNICCYGNQISSLNPIKFRNLHLPIIRTILIKMVTFLSVVIEETTFEEFPM